MTHQADRPMRAILDTREVDDAIRYQSERLLGSQSLSQEESPDSSSVTEDDFHHRLKDTLRQPQRWEAESNAVGTEVSFATKITSFSTTTELVRNKDRYASGGSQGKKPTWSSSRQRPPLPSSDLPPHPRSITRTISESSFGSMSQRSTQNNGNHKNTSGADKAKAGQGSKHDKAWDVWSGWSRAAACSSLIPLSSSSSAIQSTVPVLFLRMEAPMMDYYRNEYLRRFPDSPIPNDMRHPAIKPRTSQPPSSPSSSSTTTPPTLVRTSSGSSSCSSPDRHSKNHVAVHSSTFAVDYGTDIPCSPIQMLVDNSSFMDLAMTGSLGLVDRDTVSTEEYLAASLQLDCASQQSLKCPTLYKVLLNRRSGVPLAVCALKSPYGPPVVRIYGIKQRVYGQRPAANTAALGLTWTTEPYPLYAWAEFVTTGEFPQVQYHMYLATGSDGRFEASPSYTAHHRVAGSPEIDVLGRTEAEPQPKGCARMSVQRDGSQRDDGDDNYFFALSLSRGIDPALMICFAAIVDETMEKTLKLRCEVAGTKARKAPRKHRTRK